MGRRLTHKLSGKPFGQRLLLRSSAEFQTYLHVPRCSFVPTIQPKSFFKIESCLAGLFRISTSRLLHVPAGQHTPQQIPSSRECRDFGLHRIVRSVPPHGTNPATAISTFPLHARPEPCILGAQRLGSPHGCRSCTFTMSVDARILSRYQFLNMLLWNCRRCQTLRGWLFRRCLWRVILVEGIGWGYFIRGSPKRQADAHIRHHHHPPECFPCQAMANSNVQIIPHRTDALRVYFIHVWVACSREGHTSCPCPTKVGTFTRSSL
jgi:hypothetical protein